MKMTFTPGASAAPAPHAHTGMPVGATRSFCAPLRTLG